MKCDLVHRKPEDAPVPVVAEGYGSTFLSRNLNSNRSNSGAERRIKVPQSCQDLASIEAKRKSEMFKARKFSCGSPRLPSPSERNADLK